MGKTKPKQIGTTFETDCVKEFQAAGFNCRRIPLAGASDNGDVEIITDHRIYVLECKCHKKWGRTEVEEWRTQAEVEARNYSEAFRPHADTQPILVVSQYRKALSFSYIHLKLDGGGWMQMYLDEFINYVKDTEERDKCADRVWGEE